MTRWAAGSVLLVALLQSQASAVTLQATPGTVGRVLTQARAGDTIVLTPGSYGDVRCTGQCAPGITLAGQAGTLVRSLMVSGIGTHDLTIRGVTIDAQHQAREGVWIGNGAGRITVQDVEIRHATAHGVLLPSSGRGDNTFLQVRVHANGTRAHFDHGFYISSPRNVLRDCQVSHNAAFGVHIYASGKGTTSGTIVQDSTITDNCTRGSTCWGLLLSDGRNQQAIGNTLRNNGTGDISVWVNAPGAVLRGNRTQGRVEVRAPWQVQMEGEGEDEGAERPSPVTASPGLSAAGPIRLRLLGSRP